MKETTIAEIDKKVSFDLTQLINAKIVKCLVMNAETSPYVVAIVFEDGTALHVKCHGDFELELRDATSETRMH